MTGVREATRDFLAVDRLSPQLSGERFLCPCGTNQIEITKKMRATRAWQNDEIRITNGERGPNDQMTKDRCILFRRSGFDHSCVIRRSTFVIFGSLFVLLIAKVWFPVMAEAQSPSLLGRWNIDINFADGNKRSLRFDAQADGKGTASTTTPMVSRWGPAKPSEAKWTPGDQNSVTFSGVVEFPLGNVGRDPGTLMFTGKFEGPDSISGEVDFAPLVGERPSKHGTFKATRDNSAH